MKRNLIAIGAAALLAWGCAGVSVSSDYDHTADFSQLKTYSWSPKAQPVTGDPRIDNNALLDSRVRAAVDLELALKGFQKASTGTPDFWIAYQAAIQQKVDVMTLNNYYGYGYNRGINSMSGWDNETITTTYDEGTLILDIADPKTNKPLWRGSGQAEVNQNRTPEQREAKINEAVTQMLAKFPPIKK